jgi:arylsulfatase A-like enzyme
MSRLCLTLFLLVLPLTLQAAEQKTKPLNVIFLLVDDWGWTDAGCFGSDLYETPNINKLATDGMKFTNAYAACTVCSPTRASVMTGMYPGRTHVTDFIPGHYRRFPTKHPLMPPNWTQQLEHKHTTIAEALHEAGYRTAHIGKWHLTPRTEDIEVLTKYYPERHGFQVNVAGNQWGLPGSYFWPFESKNAKNRFEKRTMNFPEGGKKGDYLTDTLTDHTLEIIDSFQEDPFYIYLPFYAVHTPIQGKPELIEKYKPLVKDGMRHTNATYAAMVTAVDQAVGRIRKKLDELHLADNTVIFLTGDNGGLDNRKGNPTENKPLRAGKGSAYEGGVRVPLIALWPGVTPAGSVNETPVITPDYYPTILKMTGVAGNSQHNQKVDGVDLSQILRDPTSDLGREDLFWHYPHYHTGGAVPHSVIRSGDYRLVKFHLDDRYELYNLADDIGESKDLSHAEPEKAKELLDKLHRWQKTVNAQMAVKNPNYKTER